MSGMPVALTLAGRPVTVAELARAVRDGARIVLTAETRARLDAARAVVLAHAAGDAPIYGLNTGLGANLGHRIAPAEIIAFQEQLIRGRVIGVGAPLPEEVARAAFLARIVGLAQGGSGVAPAIVELMIAMAMAGLAPVLPARGSIGAADLAHTAQMAAALIGRGEIWSAGVRLPAAAALAQAGLACATLGPKDALGLANASPVTIAMAALALDAADRAMELGMAVALLAGEGYGMNPAILDDRLHAARPAPGQREAAARLRAGLAGSSLLDTGASRSIQDALSFRCMAPVFGTARHALAQAVGAVEIELNAAADSPLVLVETGEMLSAPNFHTGAIALALDTLAIALVHLATASAQRIVKLMAPQLSGLPRYLSPVGGASAGFVPLQKTVAALLAEIRLKAMPASLDAMPVSEMVEDIAPQTPLCARKLDEQLELLHELTAIEALVAAQAADLRRPRALGRAAAALHAAVRGAVPALDADRETGPDAIAVATALRAPGLIAALRQS